MERRAEGERRVTAAGRMTTEAPETMPEVPKVAESTAAKASPVAAEGSAGVEAGAEAEAAAAANISFFGEKKKKKKSSKHAAAEADAGVEGDEVFAGGAANAFTPGPLYLYETLLDRIQTLIAENNPDLQGSKKYTLKPPQVGRVGSKRVAWTNFREICAM